MATQRDVEGVIRMGDRVAIMLGRAMRRIRGERRLSQEKLAQRADVSRETVRRVEDGQDTTTAMLDRLLRAMDADPRALLWSILEDDPWSTRVWPKRGHRIAHVVAA